MFFSLPEKRLRLHPFFCYTSWCWVIRIRGVKHTTDRGCMPKPSLHVLAWSQEQQRYELSMHGHLCQSFHSDDRQQWQGWLSEHTSFAFHGRQGQMSVIKESRLR